MEKFHLGENLYIGQNSGYSVSDTGEVVSIAEGGNVALYQDDIRVTENYAYMKHIVDGYFGVSRRDKKYGVIQITRDTEGKIIPFKEKEIVPLIFDAIYQGGSNTIIVYYNDLCSYFDLDPDSPKYTQLLYPIKLNKAIQFDEKYKGFAECVINGELLYLPRVNIFDNQPMVLLTHEQVEFILPYLNLYSKESEISEDIVKRVRKYF